MPHLQTFILCDSRDGDPRGIFCQAADQLQHCVETRSPLPWRAIAVFHILDSSLRSCKNGSHDGGPCGARICQAADELQHGVEACSPMPRGADCKTRGGLCRLPCQLSADIFDGQICVLVGRVHFD